MKLSSRARFQTICIHAGQEPDASTGAIITPIYQTSTYVQEEPGVHKGFDYSRTANPTRKSLEECLAALENARYGLCFASGVAASSAVLNLLSAGDHVIVGDDGDGGATPGAGTGMLGVMRRLAAFDGTMTVSSPVGGPTLVTLEIPCALSSPKTTPSSGPA